MSGISKLLNNKKERKRKLEKKNLKYERNLNGTVWKASNRFKHAEVFFPGQLTLYITVCVEETWFFLREEVFQCEELVNSNAVMRTKQVTGIQFRKKICASNWAEIPEKTTTLRLFFPEISRKTILLFTPFLHIKTFIGRKYECLHSTYIVHLLVHL